MGNVYIDKSESEVNSVVDIPSGLADSYGNTLYSWLGSVWRGLNKGDGMVRGMQKARGIRLAQMAVDLAEASMMKDRRNAPVFHRELWRPITVRRSLRDKSQENLLVLGGDGVMGGQVSEEPYGEGTVLKVGGTGSYKNYVTYPVGDEIAGGAMTIVDNIVNPTVFLERDVDFVIRGGSIIFPREHDPLGDGSKFDIYDVPGTIWDDGSLSSDAEAVLWASDVLVDRGYVSKFISYEIGANAPSNALSKRIVNAAMDAISCGLTPEIARTLIAAMLNVPVIQGESETVVNISVDDGDYIVTTDAGKYRVSRKARLLHTVRAGAVLKRGDQLDGSFRIYSGMNARSGSDPEFERFKMDVPSIVIPSQSIAAVTKHGLYAMWGKSEVKSYGSDGNARLYFDIGGSDEDVSAFWEHVWASAEEAGVSMEDAIGKGEGDEISPAEFMLRNFVGANTMFVVIDGSQVEDDSMMRNPMFFDMLSDVVPSSMRLFLVEHSAVGEDVSDMDGSGEETKQFASVQRAEDSADEGSDAVSMRFVRPSPARVRGHKEEEV